MQDVSKSHKVTSVSCVHNNPVWFPVVTQTISMSFLWSPASSVQISPPLEKIFLGDLILLRCGVSTDSEVTWYVNDTVQAQRNHTLKIEAAAPEHSGRYQCQHGNGPKSDDYPINVLGKFTTPTHVLHPTPSDVKGKYNCIIHLLTVQVTLPRPRSSSGPASLWCGAEAQSSCSWTMTMV